MKKINYLFEDLVIQVRTDSVALPSFISEYANLLRGDGTRTPGIFYTYSENATDKNYCAIPDGAHMELDVPFENTGRLKCFKREESENWYQFEGIGTVYSNFDKREVFVYSELKDGSLDITGFLILFIQPLIRMFQTFGYTRLHAAGLRLNEKNILITGLSGRGKSTATMALLKQGHQVLSDEMPLIKKVGNQFNAYTLLNLIKLRRQALEEFFPDIKAMPFINGEDCYLKLNGLNGESVTSLIRIDQIFILEQTGKSGTDIEPATPLEVVPELFPCSLGVTLGKPAGNAFQVLMDLLSTIACFKVYFGTDMRDFADKMAKAGRV